jgi:membrane protease YdiL (CAAX protease family)
VLAWFLGGLVVTAFFVWRQDLAAMMIAHAVVDLMGFVIVPSYSRWWEEG